MRYTLLSPTFWVYDSIFIFVIILEYNGLVSIVFIYFVSVKSWIIIILIHVDQSEMLISSPRGVGQYKFIIYKTKKQNLSQRKSHELGGALHIVNYKRA